MSQMVLALLLTTVAGLSTTVGSLIAMFVKETGRKFMAISLGFAAGVMILVSFVELLPKGIEAAGFGWAHVAFFAGLVVMFLLDAFVPHSYAGMQDPTLSQEARKDARLLRVGLFVALGVGIHNFPEGIATFVGTLADTKLGVAIAVAIAIHNIPEGLAIAAPIYAATKSRKKAFWWSFLSGVAEPVGALLAAAVLLPFMSEQVIGIVLAGVGGLMVFIALDELLPASREYGEEHLSIVGAIVGMAVMAVSLWLLT